jgi:hypothetical protein
MGIYYGDIHYGVRISKKVVIDESIFLEPVYELLFQDDSASAVDDSLQNVATFYHELSNGVEYQYELLVDVSTTHDGGSSKKGWQKITAEQMTEFIAGACKTGKC